MKYLILVAGAIALASCDSAPSEESPVGPSVVCETPAEDGTCQEYDAVIDEQAIQDGNVNAESKDLNDIKEPGSSENTRIP